MSLPIGQNGWHLIAKPKASAFRGVSGKYDPGLIAKFEARLGYVAVCVVGETAGEYGADGQQNRVLVATDPAGNFKTSQQHNCRNLVVHAVLWTPGKRWAEDLKKGVERELSPYLIRGSWYELEPQMIINTVIVCAQEIKADAFELFNDHQRYLKYESEIEESIRRRPLLHKQAEQEILPPTLPQLSGKVIQMQPRQR